MKKMIITFATACMLLTAGSAAYAAAPETETTKKHHEQKMHKEKMHMKKVHEKKMHEKKVHAKSMKVKSLKAKGLKAKASEMPKTGFGGASEQTE